MWGNGRCCWAPFSLSSDHQTSFYLIAGKICDMCSLPNLMLYMACMESRWIPYVPLVSRRYSCCLASSSLANA